jgi:hypothetical protein
MTVHSPNNRLRQILDREFHRIGVHTSCKDKAEFLKVDPAVYSLYLNNHRTLSREKALQFANALRKGCSAKHIQELADELEAAKPSQTAV